MGDNTARPELERQASRSASEITAVPQSAASSQPPAITVSRPERKILWQDQALKDPESGSQYHYPRATQSPLIQSILTHRSSRNPPLDMAQPQTLDLHHHRLNLRTNLHYPHHAHRHPHFRRSITALHRGLHDHPNRRPVLPARVPVLELRQPLPASSRPMPTRHLHYAEFQDDGLGVVRSRVQESGSCGCVSGSGVCGLDGCSQRC